MVEEMEDIQTYVVGKGNDQSQRELALEWMNMNGLGGISATDTVLKVWLLRPMNRDKFLRGSEAVPRFTMVACEDTGWALECTLREYNTADPKKEYAVYDIAFV